MRSIFLFSLLLIGGMESLYPNEHGEGSIITSCTREPYSTHSGVDFDKKGGNRSARPKSDSGDIDFFFSLVYWNAHQDGMDYALKTAQAVPLINPSLSSIQQLNRPIEAEYISSPSNWSFGYKLGLGYNTYCDGWDISLTWTRYHTTSVSEVEAGNNHSLIALWSAFSPQQGSVLYARGIESLWKVRLCLIDLELGREYWTSSYLTLRPYIGIRSARIKQDLDLTHQGGSWSPRMSPDQLPLKNQVNLDNAYSGVGVRSGIESTWHVQCGCAFYASGAASILYGRFTASHDEKNTLTISPHTQTSILNSKDHYRASRAILDFALGFQWSTILLDCGYAITSRLGWEHHLFFHQNQLWRVNRQGDFAMVSLNNSGQNVFEQRRGTLDTQGWTFAIEVEF